MTDVVRIARDRRTRLEAEIKRLDDFISMAEALLEYDRKRDRRAAGKSGDRATTVLFGELEAGSDSENESASERADDAADAPSDDREKEAVTDSASEAPPADDPGDEADDANRTGPGEGARWDDDTLVLTTGESDETSTADAHVGLKLRQRRWMLGMTKKELGNRIGVDVQTIQSFELGKTHITPARLWHIGAALGVPMSYFFEEVQDRSEHSGAETQSDAEVQEHDKVARIA